jgi:signal peptidase II
MNALTAKALPVAATGTTCLLLDQWSKHWVLGRFVEGEIKTVIEGFFTLTLRYNTGAAFSLFDSSPVVFFLVISAAAVGALVYFLSQLDPAHQTQIFALGAVLGGALGNLWDRVTVGGVVDFLLVHYRGFAWPAFNLADAFIVVGVIVFMIENLRSTRQRRPAGAD